MSPHIVPGETLQPEEDPEVNQGEKVSLRGSPGLSGVSERLARLEELVGGPETPTGLHHKVYENRSQLEVLRDKVLGLESDRRNPEPDIWDRSEIENRLGHQDLRLDQVTEGLNDIEAILKMLHRYCLLLGDQKGS